MAFQYLLGDSRRESSRLNRQAALWDPISQALFDRIGVARGWRVLEIGPGAGSLHLELRRRVQGPVDVLEQSAAFCTALAESCRSDGFGEGRVWQQPLLDARLPEDTYDLIFARFVFLFLLSRSDPVYSPIVAAAIVTVPGYRGGRSGAAPGQRVADQAAPGIAMIR